MVRLFIVGFVSVLAFSVSGCRNTWNGVKQDSRNAAEKTGQGLQKAGNKIENAVKK